MRDHSPNDIAMYMDCPDLLFENQGGSQLLELNQMYEQFKAQYKQLMDQVVRINQRISQGVDNSVPPTALAVMKQAGLDVVRMLHQGTAVASNLKPERALQGAYQQARKSPSSTPPPLPVNQPPRTPATPPPLPKQQGTPQGTASLFDNLRAR